MYSTKGYSTIEIIDEDGEVIATKKYDYTNNIIAELTDMNIKFGDLFSAEYRMYEQLYPQTAVENLMALYFCIQWTLGDQPVLKRIKRLAFLLYQLPVTKRYRIFIDP